jgi:hypothetical protein
MELAKRITSFEGIFCSGFLIPDQRHVTALSLLFEKVHFLNQLEYVIEFSKKYRIRFENEKDIPELNLIPCNGNSSSKDPHDPLSGLTNEQRHTVNAYLFLSDEFFNRNALLFPKVFSCSLLPNNEVLSVTLVKEGKNGALNTYQVKRNPMAVCTDAKDEFARYINSGCVPVFLNGAQFTPKSQLSSPNAKQIAANIALSSVAMVLPSTKPARADHIMEAREKLSDHLPFFWSSMMKLSTEVTSKIGTGATPIEIQHEIDDLITTTVQPALIDLVHKLEKERKDRFKNILTAAAKGLRVLAGKPPTDLAGLISGSLLAGADTAMDFANQLRKVDALKQESGMSYLVELDNLVSKNS